MSEEQTKNLTSNQSFEERVFARFDSIDKRFDAVDARLGKVETRLESLELENERRALETKPVWERALAEILDVNQRVQNLERKFELINSDMMEVRSDQRRLEDRIDQLSLKRA